MPDPHDEFVPQVSERPEAERPPVPEPDHPYKGGHGRSSPGNPLASETRGSPDAPGNLVIHLDKTAHLTQVLSTLFNQKLHQVRRTHNIVLFPEDTPNPKRVTRWQQHARPDDTPLAQLLFKQRDEYRRLRDKCTFDGDDAKEAKARADVLRMMTDTAKKMQQDLKDSIDELGSLLEKAIDNRRKLQQHQDKMELARASLKGEGLTNAELSRLAKDTEFDVSDDSSPRHPSQDDTDMDDPFDDPDLTPGWLLGQDLPDPDVPEEDAPPQVLRDE